jgi:hypothetical protein
MLSSISPVGEAARAQRWGLTATAYALGSLAGGAAVGLLAGALGQLLLDVVLGGVPADVRLAAVGVAAGLGLLLDATTGVPSVHRQVDERWLSTYRGWVYGVGFGLQLGTGVATIVPASVLHATWLGVALLADWRAGAAVGALFGLLRAAPLLAAGRIRTVAALRRALARMDRRRRTAARAVSVAQMAVAVLAVAGSRAL